MATMTLTNGATVQLTIDELQALFGIAATTAIPATKPTPKAAKPETKAERKARETRAKHDAILDTKRVDRIVKTATDKLNKAGFECKTQKQGAWVWVYPTNGQGRTPEFKAVKLAKGWKYSPKRGAFYRDFKGATC